MDTINKRVFIVIIISILAIGIKAQPYTLFIPNMDYIYSDTAHYFKGFRIINSVTDTNGDTIYYPVIETAMIGDSNYYMKQFSWISKKIISKKDGKVILFNFNNDSIIFNTLASLNDSWHFYHFKNGSKIVAKITAFDTQTVLGNIDTVKTISFEYYDSLNQKQQYKLDTCKIKLCRNSGLIKTFNFACFPDVNIPDQNNYRNEMLTTYDLAGKNILMVKNLTKKEVYNFDPGDQMDIYDFENTGYPSYISHIKTIKTKRTVLEKYSSNDTLYYKMHDISEIHIKARLITDTIIISHLDTNIWISYKINDSLFNSLPGLDIKLGNNSHFHIFQPKMKLIENNRRGKMMQKENFIPFNLLNDTIYGRGFVDGCPFYEDYYEGLGGPFYKGGCIDAIRHHLLVYYKKGNEIWGTPLSINQEKGSSKSTIVNMYPNPWNSSASITINSTSEGNVRVFDNMGKQVLSIPYNPGYEVIQLNRNDFKIGVYYFQVVPKNGNLVVRKFIVE